MPIRIAFINPSGAIGGAERSLLLLLSRLNRRLYAPIVFCGFSGEMEQELSALEVPYQIAPLGAAERLSRQRMTTGLASAACGMARATVDLARRLHQAQVDLIHTNGIKAHLIGGVCGRMVRRPVLWHVRDLIPEGALLSGFRVAADRLPHGIIAISRPVAEQFTGRRAASVTHTIHNAVDMERFRPERPAAAVRAALGIPPRARVLVMVAHFTPWKGHMLFLDVLAHLGRADVVGVIVGASIYRSEGHDAYETEVRARCKALGLEDRVYFAGYQRHVADLLSAADVLVHPPIRPEPFGRALIEAMALSKPVVAADAGGVPEIVRHGETGLLAPPGDAEAFAAACAALLDDPETASAMGRRGRERTARLFDPQTHANRVEDVYQEVLCLT